MNILLITLDQFRGDCLSCAGHPVVKTPNLDRLAVEGVRFARHYSQSAPCSPGRASLYTGMYQMNHRVVANGTPLDASFDNLALAARRVGYDPTLFGYTDQSVDPRETEGPDDPRLLSYEGVLPGFSVGLELKPDDAQFWYDWLTGFGHDVEPNWDAMLESEPQRPAEHSMSAFLTERFLGWMGQQKRPWFAHISQTRPHPPYAAAGTFSTLYDAAELPTPIAPVSGLHKLHERLLGVAGYAAPADMDHVQRQYFGMVSEADHQLGRIWAALEESGQWDDTLIIVTADHGEQLGDHGLIQKAAWFEQSYHILCIVRDPRAEKGLTVEAFTENVDIFPTLCEAVGVPVPAQCDGAPLTHFMRNETPPWWRDAAHWEYDWRQAQIPASPDPWPWDRRLETRNLVVQRRADVAYVHFGDGASLCFDLAADPSWRTLVTDPAVILENAQALLTWRAQTMNRTLTGMLVQAGGIGRWPPMPAHWRETSNAPA